MSKIIIFFQVISEWPEGTNSLLCGTPYHPTHPNNKLWQFWSDLDKT